MKIKKYIYTLLSVFLLCSTVYAEKLPDNLLHGLVTEETNEIYKEQKEQDERLYKAIDLSKETLQQVTS